MAPYRQHKLQNIENVMMLLYWMTSGDALSAIGCFFCVESAQTVSNVLNEVLDIILRDFVPKHVGFGADHVVKVDGEWVPLTPQVVQDHLQSWKAQQLGEKVFKRPIGGVFDGGYLFMQGFDGFEGRRALYCEHKHASLMNVR